MVYCSSALDACKYVSIALNEVFIKKLLQCDVVSLIRAAEITMKTYIVDDFAGRLQSLVQNTACLVGTNEINCGINSLLLYYIILEGFLQFTTKLFRLLGCL